MAQPSALDSLIEFARGQRDDALARFAASVSASQALEKRLALLLQYRDEYAARLAASVRDGLSVERLRAFQGFLDKLELAIHQQRQAMRLQSERHRERRADWIQRESRLRGYSILRDRRRAAAAAASRRDEQRRSDEHARLAAARTAKDH